MNTIIKRGTRIAAVTAIIATSFWFGFYLYTGHVPHIRLWDILIAPMWAVAIMLIIQARKVYDAEKVVIGAFIGFAFNAGFSIELNFVGVTAAATCFGGLLGLLCGFKIATDNDFMFGTFLGTCLALGLLCGFWLGLAPSLAYLGGVGFGNIIASIAISVFRKDSLKRIYNWFSQNKSNNQIIK